MLYNVDNKEKEMTERIDKSTCFAESSLQAPADSAVQRTHTHSKVEMAICSPPDCVDLNRKEVAKFK